MQNELFNQLLSDGKLGIILEDGGVNLTKAQIQKVKEAAKEQANMTLEEVQRNADILRGIRIQQGARESDVMNDYTENLQDKFDPKRVAKAMTGTSKLKGKTDEKMEEEPEEEKYDKRKDPSISKVAPNTHLRLKKGDSEADILAKMLNMMNDNYAGKRKRQLEQDRLLKLEDEKKTIRNEKLLAVFGYKKEKPKDKPKDDFSWIKALEIAGLVGVTGLGLLGMDKVFEKLKDGIGDFKIPKTLDDIRDKIANIIPHNPKYTTNIRQLLKSIKGPESIKGGEVSEDLIIAMEKVQELHPEIIITALNDEFHQKNHPTSAHTEGRAADFKLPNMTAETAAKIQKELENAGITAKIIYEEPTGSGTVNPVGHYHLVVPKTPDMKTQKEEPEPQKVNSSKNPEPVNTPTKQTEKKQTPVTSAMLKGVQRPYVLAPTDETVKNMQDVKGQPKKPNLIIIKQDTINNINKQEVKQGVQSVNERNWKTDKEMPVHLAKQTGLNLNLLQY